MKIQTFQWPEKKQRAAKPEAAQAKVPGKHEVENWSSGNQTRNFLFIDDCIEGIQKYGFPHSGTNESGID